MGSFEFLGGNVGYPETIPKDGHLQGIERPSRDLL